ncbi:MAG TPA: glycosyltransferase family 9 protein [Verrucomicrobiae bacterium]|nr:glycosyltransferase family 9 protein [Verrucomicrobiae bacterium]
MIIELWGLGDLAIATPFLRAAVQKYDVTIVAKPYAKDLQSILWPGIKVLPFVAPWTAFRGKYRLYSWPWQQMLRLGRTIRAAHFDVGLSARWDPRDHFLLAFSGAKKRLGFPRMGSRFFLTRPLVRPNPEAHRYKNWHLLGQALGLELPAREDIAVPHRPENRSLEILVHTGAGQPIRVWPLDNYRKLVTRLRQKQYLVQVACDPGQRDWWVRNGEAHVVTPKTVAELQAIVDRVGAVIGNDSGPGHLAAFAGVPTFTIFGPQLPEWFAPLHPAAQWVEGKACPYRPCSDYCRFPEPLCLTGWTESEIWARIEPFLKNISGGS